MHRYYAECKKRASLVPAAAVIPALRAYIKVVAFKTPVVEIAWSRCPTRGDRKKKGRERGKREMQYYACSICASKGRAGGERERESVCTCFNECIQILAKKPLLLSQTSRCGGCVCEAFLLPCLLSFLVPLLGACALSFVTIKKLECL